MARISLDPPVTPTYRLARWYSRRAYQAVLDPGLAMAHHPQILRGYLRFEQSVARFISAEETQEFTAALVRRAREVAFALPGLVAWHRSELAGIRSTMRGGGLG